MTPASKRSLYRRWVQSMLVDDDEGVPRWQWTRSSMIFAMLLAMLGALTALAIMYC